MNNAPTGTTTKPKAHLDQSTAECQREGMPRSDLQSETPVRSIYSRYELRPLIGKANLTYIYQHQQKIEKQYLIQPTDRYHRTNF